MLTGLQALPFKDAVRNFDVFTESMIKSIVLFNKHFNVKPSIRGDFQAVARGATSLVAKEVRGMAIDELARTITEGEKLYIDWQGMLRERLISRDIPIEQVMVSAQEAKRREEEQAKQGQAASESQARVIEAQVKEIISSAVKNLTQADKNAAATEVAMFNALAKGLTDGVTPKIVADARAGGTIPEGVVRKPSGAGGKGAARAA
jgi:hypothetical protein